MEPKGFLKKTIWTAISVGSLIVVLVLGITWPWASQTGEPTEVWSNAIRMLSSLVTVTGVITAAYIAYKNGEFQRNQQREVEDQRHDRELANQRQVRDIEDQKHDREIIKELNERFHKIIPNRTNSEVQLRIASYFELTALYKDWDRLAQSSTFIESSRQDQQLFILKVLFAPPSKASEHTKDTEDTAPIRTPAEIQALDYVIRSIIPTVDEPQRVFDFAGTDLSRLDLSGRNLNSAIFRNANLIGTNFSASDLTGADFSEAKLFEANFHKSILNSAILCKQQLSGLDFRLAHLNGADLQWAQMNGADLSEALLNHADLRWGKFNGANFYKAQLNYSKIHKAEFNGAFLSRSQFNSVNFSEISPECSEHPHKYYRNQCPKNHGAQFNGAVIYGSQFNGADLHRSCFNGADFHGPMYDGKDYIKEELRISQLNGAEIYYAELKGTNLQWALMNGVKLMGTQANRAKLYGAKLNSANFQSTNFEQAILRNAEMNGAYFDPTLICEADFANTKLNGVHIGNHTESNDLPHEILRKQGARIE